ncbi:MAG: polysaccharide deacetylase family protein [Blastocatellia bacterium]
MAIPGLGRLTSIPRRLRNRRKPCGLILMYHRISDARPDPWGLCISPRNFAAQLAVLQKYFRPVPLREINAAVTADSPSFFPRRPVAITFDDGYADNLLAAAPLLQRYETPATIFVTSGNIGRTREFWSDELERLLLAPGKMSRPLTLCLAGKTVAWDPGDAAEYTKTLATRHRGWTALGADTPTPRHQIFRELYALLQPLPETEREAALAELARQTDIAPAIRESHRFLTAEELITLDRGEGIEIGGHTATHPKLSALTARGQEQEIVAGKEALEQRLGHALTSFAYPYGDYDEKSPPLARAAGFDLACTTRRGVIRPRDGGYELPRFQIHDWNGREFAAWLSHWIATA